MGSPLSDVLAGVVLVLSVSSAHAARPWSVQFGGCVFSGDYDGAPLVRSGSCATKGHSLNLYDRGITSVKSDSFADMGACEELLLGYNQLTSVAGVTFPSSLETLILYNNQLTSVAGVTFPSSLVRLKIDNNQLTSVAGVTFPSSLQVLYLNNNEISGLPAGVFDPLTSLVELTLGNSNKHTHAALTCAPLTQGRMTALGDNYSGPRVTCAAYCAGGQAGPWSGGSQTCTTCAAGKFSAATSGATSCTDCDAGKFSGLTAQTSSAACTSCDGFDSADELRCLHQLRRWQVL